MIPTPPFRLRNRLAETILSALRDPEARRELSHVAIEDTDWVRDAPPEDAALVRARARRASEALIGSPPLAREPSLEQALAAAALLFDAGLYFEVHELLEPYWVMARGTTRQALQGLIQIAVGFQHLANGNLEGARSLLSEGARHLRAGQLAELRLDLFSDAVSGVASELSEDNCMGGPEMAPHTPPRSEAPRPRRGAPRQWGSVPPFPRTT